VEKKKTKQKTPKIHKNKKKSGTQRDKKIKIK
jgi:hypothetical protein